MALPPTPLLCHPETTLWTEFKVACYVLHNCPAKQWFYQSERLTTIALDAKEGCPCLNDYASHLF